jgi:hypothetical protein
MPIVLNGSGTVTGISVGGLPDGIVDSGTLATDSVIAAKLEASAIVVGDLPAGSVLQVVQAVKTDTFSYTGSGTDSPETYTDVTGLTVDITPSAASSKILVLVNACHAADGDSYLSLFRGSTNLASPTSPGDRNPHLSGNGRKSDGAQNIYAHSISFLDSPSTTSSTTYKIAITAWSSDVAYINRTVSDSDAGNYGRGVSTITAMEIGA